MSRCFPFPPPGYENTPRLDGTFALKEEKKEKKHKKEKKEKKEREKREGKEKKDKDKEKRDKKEKHKKEKHKDTNKKEKEKSNNCESETKLGSTTKEGKNVTFVSNAKNGSAVSLHHQNGEQNIPISRGLGDSRFVPELDKEKDSRFVIELAKRFKDDEKVTTNQLDKSPGNFVVDKKGKEHIGINDKFRENSTVQIIAGSGKSSIGELPETIEFNEKKSTERKENNDKSRKKHKSKDGEKKSRHKKKDKDMEKEKKKTKKKKESELITQCDDDSLRRKNGPIDSRNSAIFEGIEKQRKEMKTNGLHNSSNAKISCPNNATFEGSEKRRKEMDTNGPLYPDGFCEVMGSVPSDQKNHAIFEENEKKLKQIDQNGPDKNYSIGVTEVMGSVPFSAIVEGNAKKRKDIDINGFINDNEEKLNKVRRLISHNSLVNGRKPEAHRSVNMVVTSEKHGGSSAKVEDNGIIDDDDAKSINILGPNPSVLNDQIIEKSRKYKPLPHPDKVFLTQILTVPKMDEWTGFDDQEWLFHSQDHPPPLLKPNDLQVWSEALNIESMDIIALPYVLPY